MAKSIKKLFTEAFYSLSMEDKVTLHNMYCKYINSGSIIYKHDEAFFNNVLGGFTNYEISRMIMNGECDPYDEYIWLNEHNVLCTCGCTSMLPFDLDGMYNHFKTFYALVLPYKEFNKFTDKVMELNAANKKPKGYVTIRFEYVPFNYEVVFQIENLTFHPDQSIWYCVEELIDGNMAHIYGVCDSSGKPLFDNIRVDFYEAPFEIFEYVDVIARDIKPSYVMVNINSK